MSNPIPAYFNTEAAQRYDARNSKLAAISECLHFLIRLVLKDLPAQARVLCVGAGTGAEILPLAKAFPQWTFVASDPSAAMLEVCKARLEEAGLADRCTFVEGYVQDVAEGAAFDAVLSILVSHFVPQADRLAYFRHMASRLKTGGVLVNAEIGFDLDSPAFAPMLENWKAVQELMGGTADSLAALPTLLREVLTVLPPDETESLMRQSGLGFPVLFFQAFMICAWHARKT